MAGGRRRGPPDRVITRPGEEPDRTRHFLPTHKSRILIFAVAFSPSGEQILFQLSFLGDIPDPLLQGWKVGTDFAIYSGERRKK